MTCEKHSGRMADWTTDAALGRLRPAQEAELLAHVGECDACREAYRHAREVAAAVDRGVEALVSGELSPYFATRLRARVAAERITPRSNWLVWAPVAAGVLALLVLVAVLLSRSPNRIDSDAPVAVKTTAPVPEVEKGSSGPSLPRELVNPRQAVASGRAHGRDNFPEVVVPHDQLFAALQLGDAVSGGHIDAERLVAVQNEITKPLEVRPIEIAPLESSELRPPSNDPTRF
jgi:anti-sigma factor RsiW